MKGNLFLPLLILWPVLASGISYIIGVKYHRTWNYFAAFASVAELVLAIFLYAYTAVPFGNIFRLEFIGNLSIYFKLDGFRAVYISLTSLMWLVSAVFSVEYLKSYKNLSRYYFLFLFTFGAAVGVFLSSDFFTLFIFFELMSHTSRSWVAYDESTGALQAADTYMGATIIAGFFMTTGMFLLYRIFGTLDFDLLYDLTYDVTSYGWIYAAGACMLVAFGFKSGMFPFHIWLPKAHPVAPAPASGLLSGILTKTGIFGILVVTMDIFTHDFTWGIIVLCLGAITMFVGALLALFSINLKHTLACSSISQIGIILIGIGMMALLGDHNSIAASGTLAHMINHSLFKVALFTVAGAIYIHTHYLDLNHIRGFGRGKPYLMLAFIFGALGISGMPMWSGYISKTLIHESIVEYMALSGGTINVLLGTVEALFILSGGMTLAYMLKLFVAIFIEKPPGAQPTVKKYLNPISVLAMLFPTALIFIFGAFPAQTLTHLTDIGLSFVHSVVPDHKIYYFSWPNMSGAVISAILGIAIYFLFVRRFTMTSSKCGRRVYIDIWPEKLRLDKLYNPVFNKVVPASDRMHNFLHGVISKLSHILLTPLRRSSRDVGATAHLISKSISFILLIVIVILLLFIIFK